MRIQYALRMTGQLIMLYSLFLLIPFAYGVTTGEVYVSFAAAAAVGLCLGRLIFSAGIRCDTVSIRDGFFVVGMTWLASGLLGALPFYFGGILPDIENALFESVSGITATGASVIGNVDALPRPFILWRSLMHWAGGMGIVVLVLAFVKNPGAEGAYFFNAESTVPRPGVVLPRIRSTASALWKIYMLFTASCFILLLFSGVPPFDALNMSLSTVSTGGFLPSSDGMFRYNGDVAVMIVLTLFMFLGGGNFTLYYSVREKGFRALTEDTEYRVYTALILVGAAAVSADLVTNGYAEAISVADALFMYTSMQTGTGFAISNYDAWPNAAKTILFVSTFLGGCSGSTTGGLKIVRLIILFKSTYIHMQKALHPRLVKALKLNGKVLYADRVRVVRQFFVLYMTIFVASAALIALTGVPPGESLQCAAGILGNVGLAFGMLGPTASFEVLHPFAKFVCMFDMIVGRLEIFTVLVLLHPDFGRGYFAEIHVKRAPERRVWNGPGGTERRRI